MRICRVIPKLKAAKKAKGAVFICLAFFLAAAQAAFAADTLKKAESKSSITMPSAPSMPSVSSPSVGSGFYAPGSADFYYGIQGGQTQKSESKPSSANSAAESKDLSSGKSDSSAALETQTAESAASILNNLGSVTNASGSSTSNSNLLTAGDLSAMNSLGLFSTVSGLLGKSFSDKNSPSNQQFLVNQNSSDSKKLEQILADLSELKAENASSDGTVKEAENSFSTAEKSGPKILRFIVNGYDILSTCKAVYFSDQESDGTFLLTGDRKYLSANKIRSETFYFFFRAEGASGGIARYKVTPAVSQDYENKYSFLYGLTQENALEAQRTGNLITLRSGGEWKMDLLISM